MASFGQAFWEVLPHVRPDRRGAELSIDEAVIDDYGACPKWHEVLLPRLRKADLEDPE